MAAPKKCPDELRARAVRLYREADPKPVIRRLAEQLGVHPEALRNWIRRDQADHGLPTHRAQPLQRQARRRRGYHRAGYARTTGQTDEVDARMRGAHYRLRRRRGRRCGRPAESPRPRTPSPAPGRRPVSSARTSVPERPSSATRTENPAPGSRAGLRVLGLAGIGPGPHAAMVPPDLGAP
ncbi:transposase [Cryptosporangium minutisporangium]|uniref:transposase n=1 Tax=Cryptosporangium minutisporangium TaxID=113569 RepID=UPI0035EB8969